MYRMYIVVGRKAWSYRVNVLINFRLPWNERISDLPAELSACQDGFCSTQSATCLTLTGPTSSYIRLTFTLYQVQSQAQIHTVFRRVLDWLSLSPSYLVADIIIWRLEMLKNKFRPDCYKRIIWATNFKFMVPWIAIIYYNNPTRCGCEQSILFHCSITLHVSGAFHTHHQEYN